MKNITLEQYKKGKIAINPCTQEEYDSLMRFFESNGINFGFPLVPRINHFLNFRGKTCISYGYDGSSSLGYDCKAFYKEEEGYKIIDPYQLKEFLDFIGLGTLEVNSIEESAPISKEAYDKHLKPKYITTHAELLKLHGRSVTCKIEGNFVDDAKICVGGQGHNITELICICCSISKDMGVFSPTEPLGYKQAIWISMKSLNYENDNRKCIKIKLKEETQNLTVGQAIDYMLESEENVIEYYDKNVGGNCLARFNEILEGKYKEDPWTALDFGELRWMYSEWTKIRKHIEPKTKEKTLKELLENKEHFEYEGKQYRFDKNGAIITRQGHNVSLKKIKELLEDIEIEDMPVCFG